MKKIIITGKPGVGKTTVFMKAIEELRRRGVKVGGMFCPEVRGKLGREGFKVVDLESMEEGWLASVKCGTGPTVGKYVVNISDLENIGVKAIRKALSSAEIVAIDEVGPMELKSQAFKQAIEDVLKQDKKALLVVHWKLRGEYSKIIPQETRFVEVTHGNRGALPLRIVEMLLAK